MVGGMAERGSVEVWLADPAHLNSAADEGGSLWLSAEEHARLDATVGIRTRGERLAAYLLARWALARRLGQRPFEVALSRDSEGRPTPISHPEGTVEISIAHTRRLVVCGVAENARIGVDAEHRRPHAPAGAIARRFFCPDEMRSLEAAPESTRVDQFWALWTLKEAFVKATGADLFDGLGACAFRVGERGHVEHVFSPASEVPPGRWAFELFAPSDAHYLAIAVRVEPGQELPTVGVRDVTAELFASVALNSGIEG
jgi:4'-phosphopantetheinyl transferase